MYLRTIMLAISAMLAGSVLTDLFLSSHGSSSLFEQSSIFEQSSMHPHAPKRASIAKVTMLYGEPNPLYERALRGHDLHNEKFGYPMFVLREQTLSGYWSKPAYILELILRELAKPEEERLKWLFWVDGDIVVMNPNIPLEIFLPPEPSWSHIHAVVTNDHRGLNNGAFFLRIHEWSAWLMSAVVSTTTFKPDVPLKFSDQTAMGNLVESETFRNNTMHVPQRWFNAYAGYRGEDNHDPFSPPSRYKANSVLEGDLQVHLAGNKEKRVAFMQPYMDVAEMHLPKWEVPLESTTYSDEIAKFWQRDALQEKERMKKEEDRIRKYNEYKQTLNH